MKIIQKLKNIFRKPEPIIMKPPEVKITTIPTEHFRGRRMIPYNLFLEENPYELENQAKNLLIEDIEKIIKERLIIKELPRNYGDPYIFETDIFIGFGGN